MSLQFFEFVSDSEVDICIDKAINDEQIKVYSKERYSIYHINKGEYSDILPRRVMKEFYVFNTMRNVFLYEGSPVNDFRTFCYLISEKYCIDEKEKLLIQRKEYPVQLCLKFDNFEDFTNVKKFML